MMRVLGLLSSLLLCLSLSSKVLGYEDASSVHEVSFDFAGVEHHLSRTGTGDEIVVSIEDAGESLCSNFPGAWRTLYRGQRCEENPNQIEWLSVRTVNKWGKTIDAANNWPCEWTRESFRENEEWVETFVGSCGVPPSYEKLAEKLPSEVYTFSVRNQQTDLCFSKGDDTIITTLYEGFPCPQDPSKMVWNSLRTIDYPIEACAWLRDGPGMQGATDPDFVKKFLGTGCGEAPMAFEGILPTDSATVIAKSKREKAMVNNDDEIDEWERKRRLERQTEASFTMAATMMSFFAHMSGNDEYLNDRSLQLLPANESLPLTQPVDTCDMGWLVNQLIRNLLRAFTPSVQAMKIQTRAENLEYLIPCRDLPLTRVRNDGTYPVFGYIALYSFLVDVIKGVVGVIMTIDRGVKCLAGEKRPVDKPGFDGVLDKIFGTLMGTGSGPKLDFIPLKWKDPNNCVDHQGGDTSVKCSNDKHCCSYQFGTTAEFHPTCSNGVCVDFNNRTASCYLKDQTCKTGRDCCQREDKIMVCLLGTSVWTIVILLSI